MENFIQKITVINVDHFRAEVHYCFGIIIVSINIYLLFVLYCTAGDIHTNPGQTDGFCDKTLCYINIRSLSEEKLRCSRADIPPDFDIIALYEAFVSDSLPDSNVILPRFHASRGVISQLGWEEV